MAEDQDILAQLETPAAAPPKKSRMGLIVIILAVLAMAGGGYFAYTKYMAAPTPSLEEKEAEKAAGQAGETPTSKAREEPVLGVMFTLDPFIVNLAGSQGKRFLKVTVTLELSAPEVQVELKENLQKIIDSILILLSSKTFDDVYSLQGKFKLKDEITTRVNRFLVLGHVKDAYFTEFVIQ